MTARPGNKRAAKLNPEQVAEMRRLYSEENWTQGRLARHFAMSVGQVGRIVRGEHWHDYTRPPTDQEIAASTTPVDEDEVRASEAKLLEKLSSSSPPSPPAEDPIEEILRRRSRGEDPLARFRSPSEAEPSPEEVPTK
jgi:hypothetical protein